MGRSGRLQLPFLDTEQDDVILPRRTAWFMETVHSNVGSYSMFSGHVPASNRTFILDAKVMCLQALAHFTRHNLLWNSEYDAGISSFTDGTVVNGSKVTGGPTQLPRRYPPST